MSRLALGPTKLCIQWVPGFWLVRGGSEAGGARSGSTDLQLLLRLQMSEAVLLVSQCAFMAQTGTALALTVCSEYD